MAKHLVEKSQTFESLEEALQWERALRQRAESLLEEKTSELHHAHEKLKENQAQLVHSEKMASLGQLAAGVAHEINNPVGFVMSNLGTLMEYVTTFKDLIAQYDTLVTHYQEGHADEIQALLEAIHKVCEEEDLNYAMGDVDALILESQQGLHRVKDIVQNLKSFARLDESELKEANVNDGIQDTLKMVWNELKYKCQVTTNLGEVPSILCYPGQLNQVLMNLLVNAAQAIPEKGEIIIETEATDTHIVIRISDTGVGIPEKHMSHIFNPFYTTKPVGTGTGLGLSISYGIIQKHHGTIDVESKVGEGTTFSIKLPIETNEPL